MDHTVTLRSLITDEMEQERPNFELLDMYMRSLREVIISKAKKSHRGVGLDDIEMGENPYERGGGAIYAHARKGRYSDEDETVAAIGDIVARSGPDPLAAILTSLPNVEALYTEEELTGIRERLRTEIDKRLSRGQTPTA